MKHKNKLTKKLMKNQCVRNIYYTRIIKSIITVLKNSIIRKTKDN